MAIFDQADDPSVKHEQMLQRYRNVFGTAEGLIVLGDILKRNHFGVPLNNETERHEYNVAVEVARMCGMLSQIDALLGIEGD